MKRKAFWNTCKVFSRQHHLIAHLFIFVAFAISGFLGSVVLGNGFEGAILGMFSLVLFVVAIIMFAIILIAFLSYLLILWEDFKKNYRKELEKLKIEEQIK